MFNIQRPWCILAACFAAGVAGTWTGTASGAVDYTTAGAVYLEDFNALANSGTGEWTNNETLPGVYAFYSGATNTATGIQRNEVDEVDGDWQAASAYATSPTSSGSSTLWSWGSAGDSDRAFGAIGGSSASNQPGDFFYGLALRNTSGQTLTEVTVTYTGEQWREARVRDAGDPAQPPLTLEFSYHVFDAFTADDVWTDGGIGDYTRDADLDFTTPTTGNQTESYNVLDGNAAANRTTLSKTLTGLEWADGEVLVIRWWQDDAAGFDHGVGIDDLSVVAVPEPASLALVFLGLPALMRRRR